MNHFELRRLIDDVDYHKYNGKLRKNSKEKDIMKIGDRVLLKLNGVRVLCEIKKLKGDIKSG